MFGKHNPSLFLTTVEMKNIIDSRGEIKIQVEIIDYQCMLFIFKTLSLTHSLIWCSEKARGGFYFSIIVISNATRIYALCPLFSSMPQHATDILSHVYIPFAPDAASALFPH